MTNKLFKTVNGVWGVLKAAFVMSAVVVAAIGLVAALWVFGPIMVGLWIGVPLWFVWNWLTPVYAPTLPALPLLHVVALIAAVIFLRRLFNSAPAVSSMKGRLDKMTARLKEMRA